MLFIISLFISFQAFTSLTENEEELENTIYLSSNINEVFASTELTQYFINPLEKTIELIVSFPIKKEINLLKFEITMGEKIVVSKVLPKEEAEEKYENSIYSGDTGFISKYDEEMSNYEVNIGNIEAKQKIKLRTYFIQNIGSQDMSYEFVIMEKYPTFHYEELNIDKPRNKKIIANFEVETQSKITRLIAPFYDEKAKNNSIYEVSFSDNYKKANIVYIKNPDEQTNIDTLGSGEEIGYAGQVNKPTFFTSFCILFRTENMNKPILYYQYNPELDEISYSINYVFSSRHLQNIPIPEIPDQDNTKSYYSIYEENIINDTPGLFIFVIDQSGSMQGKSIELVRKALLLFIQSLPPGSYFQFIGFGTNFIKYNENPVEYNKENVENIIEIISNMQANLGGTNINSPLEAIYKDTNYSKINLSKNILILTDGQIFDRDQCIDLITANSDKFRINSLGIGDSFDKVFIERSGKLGKGSFLFVENVEEINTAVINTLNKCLRHYITDIDYNFKNYKNNFNSNIISCNQENDLAYQDEIINFSFILNEDNKIDLDEILEPIQIEIIGKNPIKLIKEITSFDKENSIKLPDGDLLSKMIVGKALKNNKDLIDDKDKEVEFSIKYQILSKNTALFAVIINDNDLQENKLITVNLNNYISKPSEDYFIYNTYSTNGMAGGSMPTSAPFPSQDGNKGAVMYESDYESEEEKEKDSFEDITTQLIMKQDIIEGFWDENEETKNLINLLGNDIYNNIDNKIKMLNIEDTQNKIKYTILVIYYLNNKLADKINDYRLIINKANNFLLNQGITYEDFIKEI